MNEELKKHLVDILVYHNDPQYNEEAETKAINTFISFLVEDWEYTPAKWEELRIAFYAYQSILMEHETNEVLNTMLIILNDYSEPTLNKVPFKFDYIQEAIFQVLVPAQYGLKNGYKPQILYERARAVIQALQDDNFNKTQVFDEWTNASLRLIYDLAFDLPNKAEALTGYIALMKIVQRLAFYDNLDHNTIQDLVIHILAAAFGDKEIADDDSVIAQILHKEPNGFFIASLLQEIIRAFPHFEGNNSSRVVEEWDTI